MLSIFTTGLNNTGTYYNLQKSKIILFIQKIIQFLNIKKRPLLFGNPIAMASHIISCDFNEIFLPDTNFQYSNFSILFFFGFFGTLTSKN